MSTENLENSVIIIGEGLLTLKGVIFEITKIRENLNLVLEENDSLKTENIDLENDLDKYRAAFAGIREAMEDT